MTGGSLVISRLSAGYGRKTIVSDISLPAIRPGEVVALVGPNGCGKSTLLRALSGLIRAGGDTVFDGVSLRGCTAGQRARLLAFLPQAHAADVSFLVVEAVVAALEVAPPPRGGDVRHLALSALSRLGITHLAFEPLNRLSGGQRQMAMLAATIARDTPLLLLDEPTSALDLRSQFQVMTLIREVAAAGAIVIVVLHDLELAARWADRIVVLHGGRIEAFGTPLEAITREIVAEVYGVETHLGRDASGALQLTVLRPF
nr:ABC transporter ATP-binding protein [Shinella zoogloeoides]